jgi:hypothetical protein
MRLSLLLTIWFGLSLIAPSPTVFIPATGFSPSPTVRRIDPFSLFPSVSETGKTPPSLSDFILTVENGDRSVVRGVYAPGILASPVIQQPEGDLRYISEKPGRVTEFQASSYYGIIGLLAHNYLAGKKFYLLAPGDEVVIIFGDGSTQSYQVAGSYEYQSLDPGNPYGDYLDLSNRRERSLLQVFRRFYQGPHKVTFQTCLERDGDLEWGVYFVVAEPVDLIK